jgi:hypothetical protein
MSSIGKILATFVTYPILTIRVKLQADKSSDGENKMVKLLKTLSVQDLYHGIEAKIIQTVLNNAFLMMTYEKMRTLIKIIIFRAIYLKT